MPLYLLKCLACGHTIEYLGKHSDIDSIRCPECSEKMVIDYSQNTFSSKCTSSSSGG